MYGTQTLVVVGPAVPTKLTHRGFRLISDLQAPGPKNMEYNTAHSKMNCANLTLPRFFNPVLTRMMMSGVAGKIVGP